MSDGPTSTPSAFGFILAPQVTLEASVLNRPLVGAITAALVLAAAGDIYETLTVTHRTAGESRIYLENTATAFGGSAMSSVVVLTLDDHDRIDSIAIHHRPLRAVLAFSRALADRLHGVVDRDLFLPS